MRIVIRGISSTRPLGSRFGIGALCLFAGILATTLPASAHVSYGNSLFSDSSIIDPVTGIAGTGIVNHLNPSRDSTVRSNAGWAAGLNGTTWANSHDNRFFYFNLAQTQTVAFSIIGGSNNGQGFNPGYSIFKGVVPNAAYDGATVPPSYIGAQTGFADWSPFKAANSAITANGGTLTTQHWGQFRSIADFTLANNAGQVATLEYTGLFGANSTGTSVVGRYILGPGVYSLIVGGANSTDLATLLSHAMGTNGDYTTPSGQLTGYNNARSARAFSISFNVLDANPVPVPAAVWLFGSGLAAMVGLVRRRANR